MAGDATNRSPFGANRMTRGSVIGSVVNSRAQKPLGTDTGASEPGRSQNLGPVATAASRGVQLVPGGGRGPSGTVTNASLPPSGRMPPSSSVGSSPDGSD